MSAIWHAHAPRIHTPPPHTRCRTQAPCALAAGHGGPLGPGRHTCWPHSHARVTYHWHVHRQPALPRPARRRPGPQPRRAAARLPGPVGLWIVAAPCPLGPRPPGRPAAPACPAYAASSGRGRARPATLRTRPWARAARCGALRYLSVIGLALGGQDDLGSEVCGRPHARPRGGLELFVLRGAGPATAVGARRGRAHGHASAGARAAPGRPGRRRGRPAGGGRGGAGGGGGEVRAAGQRRRGGRCHLSIVAILRQEDLGRSVVGRADLADGCRVQLLVLGWRARGGTSGARRRAGGQAGRQTCTGSHCEEASRHPSTATGKRATHTISRLLPSA
jgi:hypothetical protein